MAFFKQRMIIRVQFKTRYPNALLLSSSAEQGHDGTFTFLDPVTSFDLAFAAVLGSFFTCITWTIQVKYEFDEDHTITHTHSIYPHEPKNLPSRTLTLHDLNTEETRHFVFEIQALALAALLAHPMALGK